MGSGFWIEGLQSRVEGFVLGCWVSGFGPSLRLVLEQGLQLA